MKAPLRTPVFRRLQRGYRLNIRAEVFNIFDHLSYVRVQNVLNQANFGQAIVTTDPTILELVFRYTF